MLNSFWHRTQYGVLAEKDIPNVARELNPYERWWVRFAFADLKFLGLLAAGVVLGILSIAWIVWPVSFFMCLGAEVVWLIWTARRHRR